MNHRHDTEPRTERPVFETDGQQYTVGDLVRFKRAGTRRNRARVYQITEATGDHIRVVADECHYQLSRSDLAAIGITHADET